MNWLRKRTLLNKIKEYQDSERDFLQEIIKLKNLCEDQEEELKSCCAQNAQLRLELNEEKHHTRRSALVNEADLPKCQSVACYNCKYVTYLYHPENGAMYLLGCGKGLTCEDFVYTDENKPPVWKRAEDLLTTASIPKEYEERPECDPCLHVPRPPCHVE